MNVRRNDGTYGWGTWGSALLAALCGLLLGAQGALAATQYTEVYPPVTLDATGPRMEYPVVFHTADGDRTFVISAEHVDTDSTHFRRDVDAAAQTPGDGAVRFVSAASTDAQRLLLGEAVFTGSDPAGWQDDRAGGSLAWVTGVASGGMYAGRAWGGLFRGQAGYVGVEIPVSGGRAFGWIRVSVGNSSASVTTVSVYGYAFEDTAGVDLAAGDGATNYPPLFTRAADLSVYDTFSSAGDSVGFVSATDGEIVSDGVPISYSIISGTGTGLFAIDPATGGITLTAAGAAALDSQTAPSYTLTVQADDGQPANNTATVTLTVTVAPGIIYTAVDPPVTLRATAAGELYDVVFNTPGRGPLTYTIRALADYTPPEFWQQVGIYSGQGSVRVVGATEDASRLAFGAWVDDAGAAAWSVFSAASEGGNLGWAYGADGTVLDSGGDFLDRRGYIGVMLSAGPDGEPAYGWIEVRGGFEALSVTIYGYAFAAPYFTDIQAGARGPAPTNLPPGFTSATAFSISETATDDGATLHDVQANDGDGGAADAGVTYSIVGGTGATLFAVDPASGMVTLTAAGAVTLDFETTPSYTLQIQADDGQASNNTATQTLTVSVTDVAISVTAAQSFGLGELAVNGAVVGSVATSGDAPTGFSITAGNSGGAFAIAAAGQLTVANAGALDYETTPSFSLTVQTTDGTTPANGTVTVTVTDVGAAVTAGQSFTVSEGAANGTVVGSVATSGDAPAAFSLTGGNGGGAFAIDGAGQLTVADAAALDFETTPSYTLTVQVIDGTSAASGAVNVAVTDAGLTVTAGQSFAVSESAINGTVVGSVATSGDAPAAFSLTGGNTGGAFAIDATGRLTVADAAALDFAVTPSYTLTVQASDGTTSAAGTVSVAVSNVGPTVTAGQSYALAELSATGTVLGSVSTTGGAPTGFSITAGDPGGVFAISAAGQLTVADGAALDFETTPGYALTVQATDGTTPSTGAITVTVTDVGAAVSAGQSFTVSEAAASGAVVGSVATSGDAPASFSITAGNSGGVFSIDATGQISVVAVLDFETSPSYALTVQASDGTSPSTGTITVDLTDVNEPPVLVTPLPDRAATVDQGYAYPLPAGTFADPDAGDTMALTATLADGSALPAWLSFDPATRQFAGLPTSADLGAFSVRITATDGGGLSVSDTFGLTVSTTNFPPTIGGLTDQSTEEFQPVGPVAFTIDDADTAVAALTVTAASSDPALLPASGITLGGAGADRTITLQPSAGEAGTVQVTVSVSDGSNITTRTFDLAVVRVHPGPELLDDWGEVLESGAAVSCDCGGILRLQASGGSGSFQLDVGSAPAGAGASSVTGDGTGFTFRAADQGAFAGEYALSLVDLGTGRAVDVTYEVPLAMTAGQTAVLDSGPGLSAAVHGGAPGDSYVCSVLDAYGQPDDGGALATVVVEGPAADSAAAGNPAAATVSLAPQTAVTWFRLRCENTTQPGLEPVTSDLLRLVPSATLAAEVRDPAGAAVSTVFLRAPGGERYSATTDATGRFSLVLPAGSEAAAELEIRAAGLLTGRVAGAELSPAGGSGALPRVALATPERTLAGTITGLASGQPAEVDAVFVDDDGALRTTPAARVSGDGSGSDPYTLPLEARRYERFAVGVQGRFEVADDNRGQGFDLTTAAAPSLDFTVAAAPRYRGAETSPLVASFSATAGLADLSDHGAVAFDAQGVATAATSVSSAGPVLEASFAGDAGDGAVRLALVDGAGRVVSAVTHDPGAGADAGPGGSESLAIGGGGWLRFPGSAAGPGESVAVEVSPAGLGAPGLACEPPLATVEVRTRQLVPAVGWAPLLASASGERLTRVAVHQGDCAGGFAAVAVPPLVVTLPFDSQVVGPGDLEAGVYRVYRADGVAEFQAGEVEALPPEQLLAVDWLDGTVRFAAAGPGVFGVGLDGVVQAPVRAPADGGEIAGDKPGGCFLTVTASTAPARGWRRWAERLWRRLAE